MHPTGFGQEQPPPLFSCLFVPYMFTFVAVFALIVPLLRHRDDLLAHLKLAVCGQLLLMVLVSVVGGGPFVSSLMGGGVAGLEMTMLVHSVADDIGVPRPAHVYELPTKEMNAFVTGLIRSDFVLFNTTVVRKDTTVTITRGLWLMLWTSELKAVVAHELAHIHNGDVITGTHLAVISAGLGAVHSFGKHINELGELKKDKNMTRIGSILKLGGMVTKTIGDLHRFAVSRNNEYRADAMAAAVYGPTPMANALTRIDRWATLTTRDQLNKYSGAVSHACIVPDPSMAMASAWGTSSRLFATHPRTQDRIAFLMNGSYAGLRRG